MSRKIHMDILKVIAILGVLVQHSWLTLYYTDRISILARYSVMLFILIGGYNIYNSFLYKENTDIKQKVFNLLIPYIIGSIIYSCVVNERFNLEIILKSIIHFSASYPLYYVAVHLELLVISPIIFIILNQCLRKSKKWMKIVALIIVTIAIGFICYLTTNYTVMLDWKFWGSMLWGGPLLLIWVIGMLFAIVEKYINSKIKHGVIIGISCLGIILFFILTLTYKIDKISSLFGSQYNIITIIDLLCVCSIFWLVKSIAFFIKKNNINLMCQIITYIGKRTYYIFIYHILFFILTVYRLPFSNLWTMRIVVFSSMLIGPLILEFLLNKMGNIIKKNIKSYVNDDTI